MKYVQYMKAIKDISKANAAPSFDVAVEMFMNNIKDASDATDQYHYAGADYLNYEALKAVKFEDTKADVVEFFKKNMDKINELYNAGKFAELDAFCAQ